MGKIRKVKPSRPSKDETKLPQKDDIPTQATAATNPKPFKSKKSQKSSDKISFEKNSAIKKQKNKKDKRTTKHKNLISKINLIKVQEKESIMKKKREKTVITGDLRPLKDALPSLDELFKFKPTEIKTGVDQFDTIKTTSQLKREKNNKKKSDMIDRYKRFTNLMKDPDYKKNARETIANHIKFTRDVSS